MNRKKSIFVLSVLCFSLQFVNAQWEVQKSGLKEGGKVFVSETVRLESGENPFTVIQDFDGEFSRARSSFGGNFSIEPMDKSVKITKKAVILSPEEEGTVYTVSGYFQGQLINKTKNTVIKLNNAFIENKSGNAAIYGEAKTEISTVAGTKNFLLSAGRSEDKTAAIQGRKNLEFGGSGSLYVKGSVYHGIKGDDVKIKGSGSYFIQGSKRGAGIKCDSLLVEEGKKFTVCLFDSKNGIKADNTIKISSGNFYFYGLSTALKTDTKKDAPAEEHGISLMGGSIHKKNVQNFYSTEKNAYKEADSGLLILDE